MWKSSPSAELSKIVVLLINAHVQCKPVAKLRLMFRFGLNDSIYQ